MTLVNATAVKRLIGEYRPGLRVSGEYFAELDAWLRAKIAGHVRANGSHGTLKADVFLSVPAGRAR